MKTTIQQVWQWQIKESLLTERQRKNIELVLRNLKIASTKSSIKLNIITPLPICIITIIQHIYAM